MRSTYPFRDAGTKLRDPPAYGPSVQRLLWLIGKCTVAELDSEGSQVAKARG